MTSYNRCMNETKVRTIVREEVAEQVTKLGDKLRTELRAEINQDLAGFFGEMTRRFDELEKKLDTKADRDEMYTKFDTVIARLDEDRIERAALGHQVRRHERYLQQFPGV